MTAAQGRYGGRKVREGTVVSDKMQKTVVVAVEANFRHPLYKKSVRRVRRFMAHDDAAEAKLGDRVRIVESAPISRHKRWRVVEVLARQELPEVAAESIDLELLGEAKREETPAPTAAATAVSDEPTAAPAEVSIAEEAGLAPVVEAAEPAAAETAVGPVETTAEAETAVAEGPAAETQEVSEPAAQAAAESAEETSPEPAEETSPEEAGQ